MFRHGARVTLRFPHSSLAPARTAISTGRRHVTTAPPHATSRTWKNSALRWGVAVAGIYYYNTSPVFADHPQSNLLNPNVDALDDNRQHDTLDQLTASSRNKANRNPSVLQTTIEQASAEDAAHRQENDLALQTSVALAPPLPSSEPVTTGAAELEEEAQGEGAFNPVTGEINWDCPCLGGMAYGPCGPEFREAFSCFVYSKEEPKGMDCIDKFQNMQTCFREHPEHYKDELEDDETLDAELAEQREKLQERTSETKAQANELKKEVSERVAQLDAQQQIQRKSTTTSSEKQSPKQKTPKPSASESTKDPQPEAKTTSHTPSEFSSQKESEHGASSRIVGQPQAKEPSSEAQPESESLVPKASHDATGASATDSYSVAK